MRILVAGWHGQVALALSTAAARRDDVEAYAVGRPALDLADRPAIARTLFGIAPDVIINTAAYTDVDGAEAEPAIAFRRNSEGAAGLARQAARMGIPIIHLSTAYVFDGSKSSAYSETDATAPINVYGNSKWRGEQAVAEANPKHLILRTGWVHSPDGRNFITSVLGQAMTADRIDVVGNEYGSPTYAPHLADAIIELAARIRQSDGPAPWGIYHIANPGSASWFDVAQRVFETSGKTGGPAARAVPVRGNAPTTGRARRPANAALDCSKLADIFGISLPDWQTGVDHCAEAFVRR